MRAPVAIASAMKSAMWGEPFSVPPCSFLNCALVRCRIDALGRLGIWMKGALEISLSSSQRFSAARMMASSLRTVTALQCGRASR